MKITKLIFILILSFLVAYCTGPEGPEGPMGPGGPAGPTGPPGNDGIDGSSDIVPVDSSHDTFVANISGRMQKGPCPAGGEVLILPLENSNMYQTGEGPFIGFTIDDFGRYYIPMELQRDETTDLYAEVHFNGDCHDELNGGFDFQEFTGIINLDDDINNINPLTHVRSYVARWLFGDTDLVTLYGDPESGTTGDIPGSLALAESRIVSFLQMPDPGKSFTEMNLENADIGDAVLALFNSAVLYMQGQATHEDAMMRIAIGVIEDDQALKSEISNTFGILPLIQIKDNLESRYLDLGMDIDVPPIWNLGAPDYYSDLLERNQVVQGSTNLNDDTTCSFDQSDYNLFAVPFTFASGLETSRYIALNFPADAQVSIWTIGVDASGDPAPGTKILDITALDEIMLEGPVVLSYNGMFPESHGLISGTEYYFEIRKDEDFVLSKSCGGTRLYTNYSLASDDEGATWIGHDNNADKFFYFDGIREFRIN